MRSANLGSAGVGVRSGVAHRRLLGAVGNPHRSATVDVGDPQGHRPPAAARADQHMGGVQLPNCAGWSADLRQERGSRAAIQARQQRLTVAAATAHV